LYWETYGISPDESVEIAVWVERYTPLSGMRRLGITLNVATDPNTPVVTSWVERAADPRAFILPGPVPIIGRAMLAETATLPSGDYWLEIVVRPANGTAVRSRTRIVIK
jgi:hypothetical protein